LIRRQRPDLVHTTLFESDLAGRLASRLTSTPVVSTLANDSYGPTHYANPHVKRWKLRGVHILDAATARLAARLHAVSTSVADTMAQHLQYPRSRIDVIPRGRDAARLGVRTASRSATARQALGVGDGDQLVLAVARQEHDKGLDVLLPAIAQVVASFPAARLLVAGREGSETPVLQQLIDHHGLRDRVQLLGSRRDVPELLCAADVFVLPSRREGFAGALAEAMALETPIVASDLRPVRETAGSSCALFVEPGDVGGFARAIEGVLAEPDRARERAQRAREHFVRQLTIDAIAPRMVSFYERALGREV
jgi:glycosyltransferase involved in cell wall biosynthesis